MIKIIALAYLIAALTFAAPTPDDNKAPCHPADKSPVAQLFSNADPAAGCPPVVPVKLHYTVDNRVTMLRIGTQNGSTFWDT